MEQIFPSKGYIITDAGMFEYDYIIVDYEDCEDHCPDTIGVIIVLGGDDGILRYDLFDKEGKQTGNHIVKTDLEYIDGELKNLEMTYSYGDKIIKWKNVYDKAINIAKSGYGDTIILHYLEERLKKDGYKLECFD